MKRLILTVLMIAATATAALAQKYIVVDSEKIFKSIDEYNTAIKSLDTLAEQYQKTVDDKFKAVETLYNNYMAQKASLTQQARTAREREILEQEQAATEYQESVFGADGVVMKKRIEAIQPIQKRVFAAIEAFAAQQGCDLVVDIASNATVLYYSPAVDRTEDIIKMLK